MDILDSFASLLGDPNVAYLLFVLGIVGLVAEFYHPGTLAPGITGAVALALAIIGFTMLPVNWLGVLMILAGVGLLLGEAHTPGTGLLSVGGIVTFVLGSVLLFIPTTSGEAAHPVNPVLVIVGTGGISTFFLLVVRAALRTRRLPVATGREALLGKEGITTSALAPRGTVRVDGEDWSAVAEFEPIPAGEPVEVIGVEGVTLQVHRPHEWRLPEAPNS